jgi:hypothetical protein
MTDRRGSSSAICRHRRPVILNLPSLSSQTREWLAHGLSVEQPCHRLAKRCVRTDARIDRCSDGCVKDT